MTHGPIFWAPELRCFQKMLMLFLLPETNNFTSEIPWKIGPNRAPFMEISSNPTIQFQVSFRDGRYNTFLRWWNLFQFTHFFYCFITYTYTAFYLQVSLIIHVDFCVNEFELRGTWSFLRLIHAWTFKSSWTVSFCIVTLTKNKEMYKL